MNEPSPSFPRGAPQPPPSRSDLSASVVGFVRTLRAAGVDASGDRLHAFLDALGVLDPSWREDVYWAGRLALCSQPQDLDRYERVFAAFFGDGVRRMPSIASQAAVPRLQEPGGSPGGPGRDAGRQPVRAEVGRAASTEVLRRRDIAELDPTERAELERLLAAFELPGELRRTRRRSPANRGALDRRRTIRRMLAAGGEPGRLAHDLPRRRPRRVVLLVDVSGSMGSYADALLRFAHAAARRRHGDTEVFTLGTRLTRVTEELTHRDPDTALRAVSAVIPDWEGGTRLAATVGEFLTRWGRPGLARGAVVVVLSDGWETEDPAALGRTMEHLARLAHRVVWANPRAGRPGFAPLAGGMAAALPHCDHLVEGHSLAALEHLARVVAGIAQAPPAPAGRRTRSGARRGQRESDLRTSPAGGERASERVP